MNYERGKFPALFHSMNHMSPLRFQQQKQPATNKIDREHLIGEFTVPLKNNTIELSNPNYVSVIKDSRIFYGGSQMWFPKTNWYSKDYLLRNYGCGTIATADMFLYLAMQNNDMQSALTSAIMNDSHQIRYENYTPYVLSIHDLYTKTRRFIAVLGPKVASAINSYSASNNFDLEASWKLKLTYYDMYDMMADMLEHDIPVILSIGPNTPNLWGKKGVPFYEKKEIEYLEHTEDTKAPQKDYKPYYYNVVHKEVNGHYVTVTAIIKDDVAGRIMLRISSWGKLFYINYEEYREYIENSGGTFTSSIVKVKKSVRF